MKVGSEREGAQGSWQFWMQRLVAFLIGTVLGGAACADGAYPLQEVPAAAGKAHEIFHWVAKPELVTDKYLVYLSEEWETGLNESMARTGHAQNPTTGWLMAPRAKIVARTTPLAISAPGREAWTEIVDFVWVECVKHEMSPDIQRLMANDSHDPRDYADPLVLEVHQYMAGGWIEPGRASAEGAALQAICGRAGIGFPMSELPESTARGAALCYPNWVKTDIACQAEQGDPVAHERGIMWLRRAAEHGNVQAQNQLANIPSKAEAQPVAPSASRPVVDATPLPSVGADRAEFADFPDLRRRAEAGDAHAQFELGIRYDDAHKRDPARDAEMQKWLRKAADQGYAPAETKLGWIYYLGRGVTKDFGEAVNWYRRGAEHGDPQAMTRLGHMYEFGEGVPRDKELAHKWTNQGSEIATRPARQREQLALAGACLILITYGTLLWLLYQNKLSGWRRMVGAMVVHVGGIVLVLNTLNTYGLPELLFPHCAYGNLDAHCSDYKDLGIRHLAENLRNWQTVNLVFRFMAMIGFVLDALAIGYIVYLVRGMRSSWRSRANVD
jgi:TPR repeat protein